MPKCIRCGKPCANGETMCDECKVWFQKKTGGSTVSGVNTIAKKSASKKQDESPKINIEREIEKQTEVVKEDTTQAKGLLKPDITQAKGLGKVLLLLLALCAVIFVVINVSNVGKKHNQDSAANSEARIQQDSIAESLNKVSSLQEETGSSEELGGTEGNALFAEVFSSAPGGNYVQLTISTASATSILEAESEEYHYEPSRAIDGDLITSWQEGAPGNGEGEELTISFPQKERVKYVCLYTGNWRDAQRFYNNCRPASMTIFLGNQEFPVKFQDGMKNWYVVFPEAIETSRITFRIDSVYTGTMSPDLCISEVYAYGER